MTLFLLVPIVKIYKPHEKNLIIILSFIKNFINIIIIKNNII